jgi:hypothetical protein
VLFTVFAAWARRGYYVDFDANDEAIVYRGRTGGVLWFEPTTESNGGPNRDDLPDASIVLVEANPRFDTSAEAKRFVATLGTVSRDAAPDDSTEPTTTSRATTTVSRPPTTTAPDTTVAP